MYWVLDDIGVRIGWGYICLSYSFDSMCTEEENDDEI